MASASNKQPDEFVIRVPKVSKSRKISVLKFNANLNVDVTQWTNVTMNRQDNASVYNIQQMPTSGVGSEFGKQARDEARRKKMGYDTKRYKRDDQPWLLNVNTGGTTSTPKTVKKFRGIREGGVTQNADFWVFVKSGEGLFDAYPVDEWYNFMPLARYKTLDAEEAEEQFLQRNKILNQFALKMKIKPNDDNGDDDETESRKKGKSKNDDDDTGNLKIKKKTDSDDDVAPTKPVRGAKGTKKKKTVKKKAKRRTSDAEGDDLIASAESEDGADDGREVDYMSDSEESASSDGEPEETKVRQELRGVDEEEGIKKLMESDDEENDQEEADAEDKKKTDLSKMESMPTSSAFGGAQENESDSGSDSDDPDKEDIQSALFLQEKKASPEELTVTPSTTVVSEQSPSSKSGTLSNNAGSGHKRKNEETSSSGAPSKKSKSDRSTKQSRDANSNSSGITEEEVRRYLQRKPLSTTELVAKFKPRCQGMGKQEIVQCLADILKRLKPEQIRRNNTLYFSLKNS